MHQLERGADLRVIFFFQVRTRMPQVTGSLISLVKDLCHEGLLDWSPRIMLAMYSCEIQASSKSVIGLPEISSSSRRILTPVSPQPMSWVKYTLSWREDVDESSQKK